MHLGICQGPGTNPSCLTRDDYIEVMVVIITICFISEARPRLFWPKACLSLLLASDNVELFKNWGVYFHYVRKNVES